MRYSVGGYGTSTPNYWKIQKFGGGSLAGCTEANQWCYVCEPPSENTTLAAFSIFPEPSTVAPLPNFVSQNSPILLGIVCALARGQIIAPQYRLGAVLPNHKYLC